MPTVYRREGFEFRIYPADHDPPHVHAWRAGTFVKIGIGDTHQAPYPIGVTGMRTPDARRAIRIVEDQQEMFLERWREVHG
ncbi:MAG: DUF4160 domain-containing protein [Gemmatimonadaceae bacterium]